MKKIEVHTQNNVIKDFMTGEELRLDEYDFVIVGALVKNNETNECSQLKDEGVFVEKNKKDQLLKYWNSFHVVGKKYSYTIENSDKIPNRDNMRCFHKVNNNGINVITFERC